MLTSLIEEYRFNKNTLSKYLEITEETIDGVVMGNVECLLDDPALRDVYKRQSQQCVNKLLASFLIDTVTLRECAG